MKYRVIEFVGDAERKILKLSISKNRTENKLLAFIDDVVEEIENTKIVKSSIFKKMVSFKKSWEIRINFNGESHRFYGKYEDGKLIIMKYYLSKKNMKTPKNILKLLRRDERE